MSHTSQNGPLKSPPRPFLGGALAATEGEIPKIFGSAVSAAMRGAGEYHELKELLHVLKDVGRELKETAKDAVEDDKGAAAAEAAKPAPVAPEEAQKPHHSASWVAELFFERPEQA